MCTNSICFRGDISKIFCDYCFLSGAMWIHYSFISMYKRRTITKTVLSYTVKPQISLHILGLIRVFSVHHYFSQYPSILYADKQAPYQIAKMYRLIWTFITWAQLFKTNDVVS